MPGLRKPATTSPLLRQARSEGNLFHTRRSHRHAPDAEPRRPGNSSLPSVIGLEVTDDLTRNLPGLLHRPFVFADIPRRIALAADVAEVGELMGV